MSTISGIGGSSAWSSMSSMRPARPPGGMDPTQMKEQMFTKTDADGSGAVDKTELQGMLDAVANKSGSTQTSAEDVFTTMDSDSDGSLSADELDQGMKSLMPPPPDTMAFAQSRGETQAPAGPPQGPPPGPPPSSASGSTDPLDTNEDGTVSEQERTAGAELAEVMQSLLDAVDSDGDSQVSETERDTFLQMLSAAADSATQATSESGSSGSSSDSQTQQGSFDLKSFANLVLKQYALAASAAQTSDTALSVTA